MKIFNSLDEIQPYYNENNNTYEFIENQKMIDVEFDFNLNIYSNITAGNIIAWNINAEDIVAENINANNINADNINAGNINANNINAWNINAWNIDAGNIKAWDIKSRDINAWNIKANNINANSINAKNIEFYAVCFSYENFVCNTIKGRRENAKYFCLDSDVVINKKED